MPRVCNWKCQLVGTGLLLYWAPERRADVPVQDAGEGDCEKEWSVGSARARPGTGSMIIHADFVFENGSVHGVVFPGTVTGLEYLERVVFAAFEEEMQRSGDVSIPDTNPA